MSFRKLLVLLQSLQRWGSVLPGYTCVITPETRQGFRKARDRVSPGVGRHTVYVPLNRSPDLLNWWMGHGKDTGRAAKVVWRELESERWMMRMWTCTFGGPELKLKFFRVPSIPGGRAAGRKFVIWGWVYSGTQSGSLTRTLDPLGYYSGKPYYLFNQSRPQQK